MEKKGLFNNKGGAFNYITKALFKKGFQVKQSRGKQGGKHLFIETDKQNFYCLFKRDFFHSFQYQFPEYMKTEGALGGAGESINKEALHFAIKNNCLLLFIYENTEHIYYIHPKAVKAFCETNNLIRTQDKANPEKLPDFSKSIQITHEVTYSFPVKIMDNYLKL